MVGLMNIQFAVKEGRIYKDLIPATCRIFTRRRGGRGEFAQAFYFDQQGYERGEVK